MPQKGLGINYRDLLGSFLPGRLFPGIRVLEELGGMRIGCRSLPVERPGSLPSLAASFCEKGGGGL